MSSLAQQLAESQDAYQKLWDQYQTELQHIAQWQQRQSSRTQNAEAALNRVKKYMETLNPADPVYLNLAYALQEASEQP